MFVRVTGVCDGKCLSDAGSGAESNQVCKGLALEGLSVWHSGIGVSQGLPQEGKVFFGL